MWFFFPIVSLPDNQGGPKNTFMHKFSGILIINLIYL